MVLYRWYRVYRDEYGFGIGYSIYCAIARRTGWYGFDT